MKRTYLLRHRLPVGLLAALSLTLVMLSPLRTPPPALAVHHLAEISEVMAGFNGDPAAQYVEINQRNVSQNFVANTRLTAFNADGTFNAVLLLIPSTPNPPFANSGNGVKWIMGTAAFETASGIQADFEFSPGILPSVGMVCWGAPGVSPPANPNTWDDMDPNQYVDCLAYGGAAFTGSNPMSSPAEASPFGPGDCQLSLTRVMPATFGFTNPWAMSNDATAFTLMSPSPTNNAGNVGSLVATPDADVDGAASCRDKNDAMYDIDSDNCADGEELGPNQHLGGRRNPNSFWDFFDTPDNMTGARDKSITIGDIARVVARFGSSQMPAPTKQEAFTQALTAPPPVPGYHTGYDRQPSTTTGEPWRTNAPNGSISIGDISLAVVSFGNNCVNPP